MNIHPYVIPGVVADDKQYWWYLKDRISVNDVMCIVAEEYEISFDDLFDSMGRSGPVEARGLCYFILIYKLGYKQCQVADEFGKERGSLFHAVKRMQWLLIHKKSVYDRFINLRKRLEKKYGV